MQPVEIYKEIVAYMKDAYEWSNDFSWVFLFSDGASESRKKFEEKERNQNGTQVSGSPLYIFMIL